MRYIKQFDAVRAIAVILVIIYHWFPKKYYANLPLGSVGVDIFFVLSGFLITRILILKKVNLEESLQPKSKIRAIFEFMTRRALRIFPIYYLLLLVLCIVSVFFPNPIPTHWGYYVLYLQNFIFYFNQSFQGGKVAHLWSLAVEEQFYIIWPIVIFFINKRYIKHVLIFGVVIGTISSIFFPLIPSKPELSPVLTICCLQSFCLGGLLSYWSIQNEERLKNNYTYIKYTGLLSLFIYLYIKFFFQYIIFYDRILISVTSIWIFAAILLQKTNSYRFILENNTLINIGKISYGIYLYHNFVPMVLHALIHFIEKKMGNNALIEILNQQLFFKLFCLAILWLVAYFSYQLIEKPFLKIKDNI